MSYSEMEPKYCHPKIVSQIWLNFIQQSLRLDRQHTMFWPQLGSLSNKLKVRILRALRHIWRAERTPAGSIGVRQTPSSPGWLVGVQSDRRVPRIARAQAGRPVQSTPTVAWRYLVNQFWSVVTWQLFDKRFVKV